MSMSVVPHLGFVLRATEDLANRLLIDWDTDYRFEDFLEDFSVSCDSIECSLETFGSSETIHATVFFYDSESGEHYDTLEDGYYFMFDRSDLFFPAQPTTAMLLLRHAGCEPIESRWSVYG